MIVDHIDTEICNQTKDLDICAKIVSDIIHQIYVVGGAAQDDLALLFTNKDLLRTTIQTVINMDRKNELVVCDHNTPVAEVAYRLLSILDHGQLYCMHYMYNFTVFCFCYADEWAFEKKM